MLAEYTKLIEDGIQDETQPLSGEQDIVCFCESFFPIMHKIGAKTSNIVLSSRFKIHIIHCKIAKPPPSPKKC